MYSKIEFSLKTSSTKAQFYIWQKIEITPDLTIFFVDLAFFFFFLNDRCLGEYLS